MLYVNHLTLLKRKTRVPRRLIAVAGTQRWEEISLRYDARGERLRVYTPPGSTASKRVVSLQATVPAAQSSREPSRDQKLCRFIGYSHCYACIYIPSALYQALSLFFYHRSNILFNNSTARDLPAPLSRDVSGILIVVCVEETQAAERGNSSKCGLQRNGIGSFSMENI